MGNIFIELFLMILFRLHLSIFPFYDEGGDKYDMFLDKIILVKFLKLAIYLGGAYNMILDNMHFELFLSKGGDKVISHFDIVKRRRIICILSNYFDD